MMSGGEALEAYNTAERNLDGKLILENGLGVPVNVVGSDDNVTSVELLVEGTIYREMEGNVDSENWGKKMVLKITHVKVAHRRPGRIIKSPGQAIGLVTYHH